MLSIFSCVCWPSACLLWKNVYSVSLPIFVCLFVCLFWLHWVLVVACGIFIAACGIFSCGVWELSCGMHVGSSSLTRDRTWAPCIGSTESYPLDHQGSPSAHFLIRLFGFFWWVVWVLCIFWILTLIRYIICKYLLPFSGQLLIVSFAVQELFSLI